MTYEDIVHLALRLPNTEEKADLKGGCVLRDGEAMFWTKGKDPLLVLKLDWGSHDRLLAEQQDVLYKTPHFEGYPAVLIRLDKLEVGLALELLEASWNDAPVKAKSPRVRA